MVKTGPEVSQLHLIQIVAWKLQILSCREIPVRRPPVCRPPIRRPLEYFL